MQELRIDTDDGETDLAPSPCDAAPFLAQHFAWAGARASGNRGEEPRADAAEERREVDAAEPDRLADQSGTIRRPLATLTNRPAFEAGAAKRSDGSRGAAVTLSASAADRAPGGAGAQEASAVPPSSSAQGNAARPRNASPPHRSSMGQAENSDGDVARDGAHTRQTAGPPNVDGAASPSAQHAASPSVASIAAVPSTGSAAQPESPPESAASEPASPSPSAPSVPLAHRLAAEEPHPETPSPSWSGTYASPNAGVRSCEVSPVKECPAFVVRAAAGLSLVAQ